MSVERKKAELKPVVKLEPKKRVVETPKVVKKIEPKIAEKPLEVEEVKTKRAENKYIKLSVDAKQEERAQFSSRVKSGEIKFAYVSLEGDKYYHYYQLLKK